MKRCLRCNRTYTDDTLRFCLEDGSPLVADSRGGVSTDPEATLVSEARSSQRGGGEEPRPTEVLDPRTAPTVALDGSASQQHTAPPAPARTTAQPAQAPRRGNTAVTIIVVVVGTVLLLSLGSLAAYVYLNSRSDAQQGRVNGNQENQNRPANVGNVGNVGNNNGSSRPVNNGNSRPTPSVSPSPAQTPVDAPAIAGQVTGVLLAWAAATSARDIDTHMSYYADSLDTYYNARNVSASKVRSDRERAFSTYSSMKVKLDNIKVTPDASGQSATVTLDKTWTFEGDKYSDGSVQQQITLTKTGGRWRITGEKDLQVYYVNH